MVLVLGVDVHKGSHTVVAVDEVGRKVGEKTVRPPMPVTGRWCSGRGDWVGIAGGRWRTAGTCRPAGAGFAGCGLGRAGAAEADGRRSGWWADAG
jgi:hypothetical protein